MTDPQETITVMNFLVTIARPDGGDSESTVERDIDAARARVGQLIEEAADTAAITSALADAELLDSTGGRVEIPIDGETYEITVTPYTDAELAEHGWSV